jgi:hypothetical protein
MRFFFQRHCFWQDHHKPRMFTIRIEIQAPSMRLHDSPSKYSAQPSPLPHHFCRKEWLSHFVSDFLRYPSSAVRNGNLHVFANIFHLQFHPLFRQWLHRIHRIVQQVSGYLDLMLPDAFNLGVEAVMSNPCEKKGKKGLSGAVKRSLLRRQLIFEPSIAVDPPAPDNYIPRRHCFARRSRSRRGVSRGTPQYRGEFCHRIFALVCDRTADSSRRLGRVALVRTFA